MGQMDKHTRVKQKHKNSVRWQADRVTRDLEEIT
jgi:hypothetical protein